MTPKDIFGIVVRSLGLPLLVYAFWYLAYGFAILAGMQEHGPGYRTGYFISGFLCLAISLYFLRGAPLLLRFSYPEKRRPTDENPPPLPPVFAPESLTPPPGHTVHPPNL